MATAAWKRWYSAHREEQLAKMKAWRAAHQAERRAYRKKYDQAHRTDKAKRDARYRAAHLPRLRAKGRQRSRQLWVEQPETMRAKKRAQRRLKLQERRAKARRYYRATADARRAYNRAWNRARGYPQQPYDPRKGPARQAVYRAVRKGLLTKPTICEACGQATPSRRLHAHHHDYTKPLEVTWLCTFCHREQHGKAA